MMAARGSVWLLMILVWSGCASERPPMDASSLRGWVLDEPVAKPSFTLQSTDGSSFAFAEETQGYVTLVFFGYTNCPDVCPLHMANIGAVMKKLSPAVANQIKVVFITTDPERDTPERIRSWLDNFSTDFIGLTGTLDEVNRIQALMGLGAAYREEWPEGGYGIAHAGQVLAFTRDNEAHVMYPFGIRQADWAHDLPLLVSNGPPGS